VLFEPELFDGLVSEVRGLLLTAESLLFALKVEHAVKLTEINAAVVIMNSFFLFILYPLYKV
jgi:hypothetical protein